MKTQFPIFPLENKHFKNKISINSENLLENREIFERFLAYHFKTLRLSFLVGFIFSLEPFAFVHTKSKIS
jgi:hypothetical protein